MSDVHPCVETNLRVRHLKSFPRKSNTMPIPGHYCEATLWMQYLSILMHVGAYDVERVSPYELFWPGHAIQCTLVLVRPFRNLNLC